MQGNHRSDGPGKDTRDKAGKHRVLDVNNGAGGGRRKCNFPDVLLLLNIGLEDME